MPRAISQDLKQAYEGTLFTAQLATSVDFKHGEASAKADALLVLFDVQAAILITAWNPYSEPKTREENEVAQQRLEAELKTQGIRFLPAIGIGTADEWAEPSVLALGIGFEAAQNLAVKYQQNAYLWIEKGFPSELIFPDTEAIAGQASIIVIATREFSASILTTWTEYLCLRILGDSKIELSVRMHEGLAELDAYSSSANKDRSWWLPSQIGGKPVVGVDADAGWVVGGDLEVIEDDRKLILLDLGEWSAALSWLVEHGWPEEEAIEKIQAHCREHSHENN